MPFAALAAHLAAVCFYDYDRPGNPCLHAMNTDNIGVSVPGNAVLYLCEAVLFRGLLQGCLQPLAAVITAVVLLPLAAAFVMLCE